MAHLFSPFTLKALSLKNRVVMSPMCQYSVWAEDGIPNAWHDVHYVSRAVGGVGLVLMEMTDVHPDGRITVRDLGIWDDAQIPAFSRIIDQVHGYGAAIGIQIAHAGRKARSPSLDIVGPSPIAYAEGYRTPRELTTDEVRGIVDAFAAGARRALRAGVDTLELHGAHGYLIHQFMSPLSNRRRDVYGDPLRFAVEAVEAVKAEMPSTMPLLMRLSATEWTDEGFGFPDLLQMARGLRDAGVDLFDLSSGGNAPAVQAQPYPGYHVPFSRAVKEALGVPAAAVGYLEDPRLAEHVVSSGGADLVLLARGLLRDPYWANTASIALRNVRLLPDQYARALPDAEAPSGGEGQKGSSA